MKTIIAGSRSFSNYKLLKDFCDKFNITEVISGTAPGADRLGERYALERGIPIKRFPADWIKYGKSAGYIRNEQMADHGERLIAFWDGYSRGTYNMIKIAKEYKLKEIQVKIYP
jgi:hypothetical protein